MMPPNSTSIRQLCGETGVSDVTLYKWRKSYRNKGVVVPGDKSKSENCALNPNIETTILSGICIPKMVFKRDANEKKKKSIFG